MNARKHPSARVARATPPGRAQKSRSEASDELALLETGLTNQKICMNRASSGREQLRDRSVLAGDVSETDGVARREHIDIDVVASAPLRPN